MLGLLLGIAIAAVSFALYLAQVAVGLPGLPQMWLEPSGIVAVMLEGGFVFVAWRLAVSSYCGCHRSTSIRAYDRYLRWLYRGGHPGRFARLQNRLSAVLFAVGVLPKRAACLDIRGRRSGRVISFPVAIADFEGGRYLVAMLGKNANWVLNQRAAGGRAVLRHGRRESVHLEEVDAALRAPILKRYLQVAPGARAHIPVDWTAPLADFERIAPDYPVFRIHSESH